jgi:hypothetical protein
MATSSIPGLIKRLGPSLASDLVYALVEDDVSPEAARKRISRAKAPVLRLGGLPLPNSESFLFLDGEFGTDVFRERLGEALARCGSRFGTALQGLAARGGALPSAEFPIASGSPVTPTKGHLLHGSIEEKLLELRLVSLRPSPDGEVIQLDGSQGWTARRRAARITESLVLSAMKTWLVRTGWSSPGTVKTREEHPLPAYGQYLWDLTCPTYLAGMRSYASGTPAPGFLVADIVLDRHLTSDDLRPFFCKWDSLRAQRRLAALQPMLIAESLERDALDKLRQRGAFVALTQSVFGKDAAQDLQALVSTMENAASAVASEPERVFKLMDRLAKLEGASLNLRGALLEMIVAHLYKLRGYTVDIRQAVRGESGDLTDIDVKAFNPAEVVCCECKGVSFGTMVGADTINRWLQVSLPEIRRFLDRTSMPDRRRFEFYSATGYTDDAKPLIARLEAGYRKQPIRFLTGADVLELLRQYNQPALVNTFREQFLKL